MAAAAAKLLLAQDCQSPEKIAAILGLSREQVEEVQVNLLVPQGGPDESPHIDEDAKAKLFKIPEEYLCSRTRKLMRNPIAAASDESCEYEAEAPVTPTFRPKLKAKIAEFRRDRAENVLSVTLRLAQRGFGREVSQLLSETVEALRDDPEETNEIGHLQGLLELLARLPGEEFQAHAELVVLLLRRGGGDAAEQQQVVKRFEEVQVAAALAGLSLQQLQTLYVAAQARTNPSCTARHSGVTVVVGRALLGKHDAVYPPPARRWDPEVADTRGEHEAPTPSDPSAEAMRVRILEEIYALQPAQDLCIQLASAATFSVPLEGLEMWLESQPADVLEMVADLAEQTAKVSPERAAILCSVVARRVSPSKACALHRLALRIDPSCSEASEGLVTSLLKDVDEGAVHISGRAELVQLLAATQNFDRLSEKLAALDKPVPFALMEACLVARFEAKLRKTVSAMSAAFEAHKDDLESRLQELEQRCATKAAATNAAEQEETHTERFRGGEGAQELQQELVAAAVGDLETRLRADNKELQQELVAAAVGGLEARLRDEMHDFEKRLVASTEEQKTNDADRLQGEGGQERQRELVASTLDDLETRLRADNKDLEHRLTALIEERRVQGDELERRLTGEGMPDLRQDPLATAEELLAVAAPMERQANQVDEGLEARLKGDIQDLEQALVETRQGQRAQEVELEQLRDGIQGLEQKLVATNEAQRAQRFELDREKSVKGHVQDIEHKLVESQAFAAPQDQQLGNLEKKMTGEIQDLEQRLSAVTEEQTAQEKRLAGVVQDLEQKLVASTEEQRAQKDGLGSLGAEVQGLEQKLASTTEEQREQRDCIESLRGEVQGVGQKLGLLGDVQTVARRSEEEPMPHMANMSIEGEEPALKFDEEPAAREAEEAMRQEAARKAEEERFARETEDTWKKAEEEAARKAAAAEEVRLAQVAEQMAGEEAYRRAIKALYQQHNPQKLGDVDMLVQKYISDLPDLYNRICSKYNVTPRPDLLRKEGTSLLD